MAGAMAEAACSASSPALAKLRAAVAASFMPYVEFDAAAFMALLKALASSSVFPMVLFAKVMVLSTSAKLLTAFAPAATSGSVTYVLRVLPTACIFSPTA